MALDEDAMSQDTKNYDGALLRASWQCWQKKKNEKILFCIFYLSFQGKYALLYCDFLQSLTFNLSSCYFHDCFLLMFTQL